MNSISLSASNLSDSLSGAFSPGTDLIEKTKSLQEGQSPDQIKDIGQEFESVFVSLLLKEMRNTLDTGDGGLFGSEQSDTFGGMFDQFMGQHLSESSPLGISDAINTYLKNKSSEIPLATELE